MIENLTNDTPDGKIVHLFTPRGCGKTSFFAQHGQFINDPHDMDLLEEVEDVTDLESESFAVFND